MTVAHKNLRVHRYTVTETWGDVPADVLVLVGEPDAYCLDSYRGKETQWEIERSGKIIGGWVGIYAGISQVALDKHRSGSWLI